jgi:enoyl-CoA hydratase/carnithine racemase
MTIDIPSWETIAVTHRDGVTELRVHTGAGPLVWSATAHHELTEAFYWLGNQQQTKVAILTGTGDHYCTDLDTSGFAAIPWDLTWWEGRRMLRNLNDVEVPVISAVNGPVTIHSEIPMMADIVLAAAHAEFADKAHFATRGTVPGDGVNVVWSELLGPTRAKYHLLTGIPVSAPEARQIGFVNEILDPAGLLPRAWELAAELAQSPLAVLRYAKAALSIGVRPDFTERLSHGLGVEGTAHWALGGLKPTRIVGDDGGTG